MRRPTRPGRPRPAAPPRRRARPSRTADIQDPFASARQGILDAGRRLDARGVLPGIAGNISVRLPDGSVAITRSGGRKGLLGADGVIRVDDSGRPVGPGDRPSAETALHCQIYRSFPDAGAVVHGHSVPLTALTRATSGDLAFEDYEMAKSFDGIDTHACRLVLPVFDNDQDIDRLCATVGRRLGECRMGYALRGHGLTVWGRHLDDAVARTEAAEFLLAALLAERSLR